MGVRSGTLEGLGLNPPMAVGEVVDAGFWAGKRVLLTGHTGFKGSWMSLWLQELGAELYGLALPPPTDPALFTEAQVGDRMTSKIGDIRTYDTVVAAFRQARPQIVLHMAAQPLVRDSYLDPIGTYAANVMGTAHVLEATRECPGVRIVVNVTTDKVYENRGMDRGYHEDEPLGGFDPYSSSKAASELVTSAYQRSFLADAGVGVATARAGNVIGGGDWAHDRLVPDILRALQAERPVLVRNPEAVRPWQHVLEPLSGYLRLAERLWAESESTAGAWNFGPLMPDARPVAWITDRLLAHWPGNRGWELDSGSGPHEARTLELDITKATTKLDWHPRWELETALAKVAVWHRAWLAGDDMRRVTVGQISEYQDTGS